MPFSTRNAYYLRVSNYRTIPLFLYLDERHTDWMKDTVLQRVIAELQPKMIELLGLTRNRGAAGEKKHKVYAERGEGYQFCYFLRGTSRTEVVLLKQKTYSLRPPTPPPAPTPETPLRSRTPSSRPTPARTPGQSRSSRTRSRSASIRPSPIGEAEDEPLAEIGDEGGAEPAEGEITEQEEEEEDVKPDISEENEERGIKDYKPDVSVTYKGFGTSSLQLVLIIEPYPPLSPESYAPPSSRLSTRSASITSTARSRTHASRTSRSNISGSRYSSVSRTPDLGGSSVVPNPINMRNASKSSTPLPNSRRGGMTPTPFGETPTPGPDREMSTGRSRVGTPLFLPGLRDTPFDQDEEDLEAHLAYTEALREGRVRLPSVSRPAGSESGMSKNERRVLKRKVQDEEDEEGNEEDEPEGMERLGERLVRSSQMEEGLVRVQGGWEEGGRAEGIGEEVVEGD